MREREKERVSVIKVSHSVCICVCIVAFRCAFDLCNHEDYKDHEELATEKETVHVLASVCNGQCVHALAPRQVGGVPGHSHHAVTQAGGAQVRCDHMWVTEIPGKRNTFSAFARNGSKANLFSVSLGGGAMLSVLWCIRARIATCKPSCVCMCARACVWVSIYYRRLSLNYVYALNDGSVTVSKTAVSTSKGRVACILGMHV